MTTKNKTSDKKFKSSDYFDIIDQERANFDSVNPTYNQTHDIVTDTDTDTGKHNTTLDSTDKATHKDKTKATHKDKAKATHKHSPSLGPGSESSSCKEYTAYLIINDDLKMSKGKIASQSAHAILNVHRFMSSNCMENKAWENRGEKIVVLKASELIIKQLLTEYGEVIINKKKDKLNVFPVYDAGRTEVDPGSLTVLATTPIMDSSKPDILKTLKLL